MTATAASGLVARLALMLLLLVLSPLVAGCLAPWHPCSSLRGGDCVVLRGMVAEVPFEVAWNATTASEAAKAMGYHVFEADAFGMAALHQDWPRLVIQVDGGPEPKWRLRVEFDATSVERETEAAALRSARDMRQELEPTFLQVLGDFEKKTGWTHARLAIWSPVLVPA